MFGREKKPPEVEQTSTAVETDDIAKGKGHATPKRREVEAANKRPLVGDPNTKKSTSKAERRAAQAKLNEAMRTGDERYLPARDKGPQKRFARDFIDSRWSVGEFTLPLMVIVIFGTLLVNSNAVLAFYALILMYLIIIAAVADAVITTMRLKKRLIEKFGHLEKGVRWYAAMRMFSLRPMRMPKPQVKRGEHPR